MEKPLPAYSGRESFVFVCYAHTDNGLVYPEILRLQGEDFRIWYDDGIAPGSEWNAAIAEAIEACSVFLYFITPNAVASEHCRREVNFALEQSCRMLAVHLQDTQVPSALKLSLSHRQAILKYDQTPQRYASRLGNTLRDAIAGHHDEEDGAPRALLIGDFVLDIASQRLQKGDDAHLLDPKDMSVLLHLADAAPGLVSTEELLNRSWPGSVVGDNVVHQVIGRLRRALGDDARQPTYVETLPRRGYRLLQIVTPRDEVVPAQQELPTAEFKSPVRGHKPRRFPLPRIRWLVATGVLLVGLVGAWMYRMSDADLVPADVRSIAVLSLVDLSPDGDLDWLSDSISTELTNELRLAGVEVAPDMASRAFRDSDLDIRDIGEALNKANIIAGSVRKSGDRIRVTLEMISVENLDQEWFGLYSRTLDADFNAEIEIAAEAAIGILASFDSDQPALRLPPRVSVAEAGAKPSLQELFDKPATAPGEAGFPSLDDLDVLTVDEMGDVE